MESVDGADNSSYLDMASPPAVIPPPTFSFPPGEQTNGRATSVRYTREPRSEGSEEGAALVVAKKPERTSETEKVTERVSRSYSSASRLSGPGWRSNIRGDYKGQDITPVCTKVTSLGGAPLDNWCLYNNFICRTCSAGPTR